MIFFVLSYVGLHFDNVSMLLYVLLGLISMWAVQNTKIIETQTGKTQPLLNKYYVVWGIIWVIVAVFRKVAFKLGGTDALNYIGFFEKCMHPNAESFYSHFYNDICYRLVNQLTHILYPDYHVFFLVVYAFIVFSMMYFCGNYVLKKTNYAPFILLFYLFLRSFNTIRSNLAISVLMVACVFLLKRKYTIAFLVAIVSVLFHKSSALFAMVIPFCWYFRNKTISLKPALCLLVVSIVAVPILQIFAIDFITGQDIDGVYQSYISTNIGNSFWKAGWTIAFEQMLLGAFMLFSHRKMQRATKTNDDLDNSRMKIIWNICIFDMLLIPINFGLRIWRGYEYFYVARLVMWGYLIYLWVSTCHHQIRPLINFLLVIAFVSWMIFRVYSTWEDSGLMPYVFDLF